MTSQPESALFSEEVKYGSLGDYIQSVKSVTTRLLKSAEVQAPTPTIDTPLNPTNSSTIFQLRQAWLTAKYVSMSDTLKQNTFVLSLSDWLKWFDANIGPIDFANLHQFEDKSKGVANITAQGAYVTMACCAQRALSPLIFIPALLLLKSTYGPFSVLIKSSKKSLWSRIRDVEPDWKALLKTYDTSECWFHNLPAGKQSKIRQMGSELQKLNCTTIAMPIFKDAPTIESVRHMAAYMAIYGQRAAPIALIYRTDQITRPDKRLLTSSVSWTAVSDLIDKFDLDSFRVVEWSNLIFQRYCTDSDEYPLPDVREEINEANIKSIEALIENLTIRSSSEEDYSESAPAEEQVHTGKEIENPHASNFHLRVPKVFNPSQYASKAVHCSFESDLVTISCQVPATVTKIYSNIKMSPGAKATYQIMQQLIEDRQYSEAINICSYMCSLVSRLEQELGERETLIKSLEAELSQLQSQRVDLVASIEPVAINPKKDLQVQALANHSHVLMKRCKDISSHISPAQACIGCWKWATKKGLKPDGEIYLKAARSVTSYPRDSEPANAVFDDYTLDQLFGDRIMQPVLGFYCKSGKEMFSFARLSIRFLESEYWKTFISVAGSQTARDLHSFWGGILIDTLICTHAAEVPCEFVYQVLKRLLPESFYPLQGAINYLGERWMAISSHFLNYGDHHYQTIRK